MDHGQPISYLSIEPGVDVFASDGERVGALEHVLSDGGLDVFDGIVVDIQLGPGGLHFADADQVEGVYERAVVLTVPAAEVERLPKPSAPAAMEHHGAEDASSPLQDKLRRAWDLISGR